MLRQPIGITVALYMAVSWSRREDRTAFLSRPSPRLPRHDGLRAPAAFGAASALLNITLVAAVVAVMGMRGAAIQEPDSRPALTRIERPRLVFLVEPTRQGPGGGGGGGGNRQPGPIPRAQARGRDSITLPIAKPIVTVSQPGDEPPPQAVILDAKPLASGAAFQVGLPDGPPMQGTSQGPGSGGGVGEGTGSGIGSGTGPGLGAGSGGGTGGGVYRPGGGASAPTVLREVKPKYSPGDHRLGLPHPVVLLDAGQPGTCLHSDKLTGARTKSHNSDRPGIVRARQTGRNAGEMCSSLLARLMS